MNRNMEAITWALHARGISPTAFRLLIQLCSFVNSGRDDFEVWPSQNLLAERVEISVSGVKRHLKELVDRGYISVRPGERDDGATSSNRHAIAVRTLHQMPDGARVKVTSPPVQSDLPPQVRGERGGRSLLNGANELLKEEPLKERTTPLSFGEEAPNAANLFGDIVEAPQITLADRVLAEWKKLAKEVPGIATVRVLDETARKKIEARAKQVKSAEPDGWKAWQQVFAAIRGNTYLRGEDPPGKGYTDPFRLRLAYVLRADEFLKIFDGGYRANRTAETHDANTGRRYGPAEQAARAAVTGIRASRHQHRDGGDGGGGKATDGADGVPARRLRSAFDEYRVDPTR